MTLLLFLLCVCSCILHNIKDVVMLTGSDAGAEVIPFMKVWGLLPASVCVIWLFSYLSSRFSQEVSFYVITSLFLFYCGLFAFVFFPNREVLHLTNFGQVLKTYLPEGGQGFIIMVTHWSESIFFIAAELWPTMIITTFFWGFLNQMNTPSEAARLYGILKLGSTSSAFVAGHIGQSLIHHGSTPNFLFAKSSWEQTLMQQILCFIFLGIVSIALFWRINGSSKRVVQSSQFQKDKLSLKESLRHVIQSRYLSCITLLVIGYIVTYNLVDVLWKAQVKEAFSNPNDLSAYMNAITSKMGMISFFTAIICPWLISTRGWSFLAFTTPCIMMVASMGFFFFFFAGDGLADAIYVTFGLTPMAFLLGFGALQNCLGKAAKFSAFDISKEMALTALDSKQKWSAKTAIDGIGTDVGKMGTALFLQTLLMLCGSVVSSAPYIFGFVVITLSLWLISARELARNPRLQSLEGRLRPTPSHS